MKSKAYLFVILFAIITLLGGSTTAQTPSREQAVKEELVRLKKDVSERKPGANNELGTFYSEALNDNRKAVMFFKRSAEEGDPYGACNLALHYALGKGVAVNKLLSLKWAYVGSSINALHCHADIIEERVKPTKAQANQAWEMAIEFLKAHPEIKDEFDRRPWLDVKN